MIRVKTTYENIGTQSSFLTRWHGEIIARQHAFLPTIRNIIRHQMHNELTTISIIGREGTGKTTLALTVGHYLHTEFSKVVGMETMRARPDIGRYSLCLLRESDFNDFQGTLDALPQTNRILIFDDISFMTGSFTKKEIDKIKSIFTKIRHLQNSKDVKTIVIFNFHYSKGLDKYLRDTHFKYFTSITNEEIENIKNMTGRKNQRVLESFSKMATKFTMGGTAKFQLNKSVKVQYKYSEPFRLCLAYDQDMLKFCVYPKPGLSGYEKCAQCSPREITSKQSKTEDIVKWMRENISAQSMSNGLNLWGLKQYGDKWSPVRGGATLAYDLLNKFSERGLITAGELVAFLEKETGREIIREHSPIHRPTKLKESFFKQFGMEL